MNGSLSRVKLLEFQTLRSLVHHDVLLAGFAAFAAKAVWGRSGDVLCQILENTFANTAQMDLEALEVFAHVMRRGSLSAVARERDRRPLVRIAADRWAGVDSRNALFHRTTRRIAPHEAALLFLARIEPHLAGIRTRGRRSRMSATSSPACSGDGIDVLRDVNVSARFSRTSLRFIRARIEVSLTDRVLDLIAERFDVAIRHGPLPGFHTRARASWRPATTSWPAPAYVNRHGRPKAPGDLAWCRV